jgi:hypothetical protein
MAFDPVTAVFNVGEKLIDKFFPNPEKKAQAHLDLIKMKQAGELKDAEISMSAIVMEAKSSDPWTSRARPGFLYVMYIMILFSIPIGIFSVFRPNMATQIANGMKAYLGALPEDMWKLFGAGYLGYGGFRSWDKGKNRGRDK